jgi:DNA-binding winged helix-turn-helix (wHTH) protein/TolB-like protein
MREDCSYLYQFGVFRLEPAERRLQRHGETVSLTPKAFDTLVFLVERAGHLVEKEELMRALWPDSYVEEANLAQQVFTLRKILGETNDGGQFIETVARKGFRFVAPVTTLRQNELLSKAGPAAEAKTIGKDAELVRSKTKQLSSWRPAVVAFLVVGMLSLAAYALFTRKPRTQIEPSKPQPTVAEVKTIAVLPFKPLSAESRNESLEMGMTETLITHLSNLKQLVVRPMGAVRKYIDPQQDPVRVGQELQVDAVVDGSIQKVGDHVRVTVRLSRIRNGAALWAQQFDEKFTDIFKVQDSIAERVATTLPLKLNAEESALLTKRYSESPEAYQLYLQAQYLWDHRTDENRKKMFQYYEQAIEKDPKFALAYVGMADLQITLVGDNQIPYKEIKPKIDSNLARALALDSELAQARNLLAEVKYQFDFDWIEAEREFKRAIELNPNVASIHLAYGWYLMSIGRFDEAIREMERAQELDPHSMVINRARGRLFYFMHQFNQAIEHLQRIANAEPRVALNHRVLADAYEQKGMYEEAVEEEVKAATANGAGATKVEEYMQLFRVSGWYAYLQRRKEELMKAAAERYVSPVSIAGTNARLGNRDEAFTWLEKAVDERSSGIPNLKVDPGFDNLHSDPRFAKLLARMNITPEINRDRSYP